MCAPASHLCHAADISASTCLKATGPSLRTDKCKSKGETPFATFEGAEDDKYPTTFTLRKKGAEGAEKVCRPNTGLWQIWTERRVYSRGICDVSHHVLLHVASGAKQWDLLGGVSPR